MTLKRMDNVEIVVEDLGQAIDFFRELGRRLGEILRIDWKDWDGPGSRVLVRDMKHPGEKAGRCAARGRRVHGRGYYETGDYFGPDRRRKEMDTPDGRRVGLAGHARYHFIRSPDAGIKIVKHEVFAAPIRPMLDVA